MQSFPKYLALALCCAISVAASNNETPECDGDLDCVSPMGPITALTPGISYVAKVPCLNCTVAWANTVRSQENDLFLNITLSSDHTSLLLNSQPFFPFLSKTNHPRGFHTSQVSPNFSSTGLPLFAHMGCDQGGCSQYCYDCTTWVTWTDLDYDFSAKQTDMDTENGFAKWEVTFDAIGGNSAFGEPQIFNHSDQKMLQIWINGKQTNKEESKSESQAASTLFGSYGQKEPVYELEISDVQLVRRTYTFPNRPDRSPWQNIKHFFGTDPQPPKHHLVYLTDEWDAHGKRNTLRNLIGEIIYDWPWASIGIIGGSVLAVLLGLYLVYRLFFWVVEQRRLAKWGGIDEVWRQLRDIQDERERLLEGGYRDDPDDIPPPAYTDEVHLNKPLPSIPVSDKPLPTLPLVDEF